MKHLLFLVFSFLTIQTFAQTTATIPLVGTVKSKAADATVTTVKWSVQSGTATIANPNALSTTAVVPVGVTVFSLVGTDNFGTVSAPAYKKVTVIRNNVPPIMDAGSDTTIQLGSSAFVPNKLTYNDLVYRGNTIRLSDNTYKQGDLIIKIEDLK